MGEGSHLLSQARWGAPPVRRWARPARPPRDGTTLAEAGAEGAGRVAGQGRWRPVAFTLLLLWSHAAGASFETVPVCVRSGIQTNPDADEGIVVWEDWRSGEADIYGWSPGVGEFAICTAPGCQLKPAIDGGIVVWQDGRNVDDTGWDVYMWSPAVGERSICTAPGDQRSPRISRGLVVWEDWRRPSTAPDVYLWSQDTGEVCVCAAPGPQIEPVVYCGTVAWADNRRGSTGWDIHAWRRGRGEFTVCGAPGKQVRPAQYGTVIVWEDHRCRGVPDIYAWSEVSGTFALRADPKAYQCEPDYCAGTLVWTDSRAGRTTGWDVFVWNRVIGDRCVCSWPGEQCNATVCEGLVVWVSSGDAHGTGDLDIWACTSRYIGTTWSDLTEDGVFDARDVRAFLDRWRVNRGRAVTGYINGDMDEDGVVTVHDAARFLARWVPLSQPY